MSLEGHFGYGRLLRYCLAPILTMIFTSIYGVIDGFFISNFAGKTDFAAINLAWPVLMILGSIGLMFGAGGTALVARTLGENKPEQANRYFAMVLEVSAACAILLSVIGILLMPSLADMLGASAEMRTPFVHYGRVFLFFNIMYSTQYFFQPFFAAAGKPALGFWITCAAGLTNMVLDWLFIAVFDWGVGGAALASGLGQTVGSIIPLVYFCSKKNQSLLHLAFTRPETKPVLKAAANGSSELMSNIAYSVVAVFFNYQLLRLLGPDGVAAYGVLAYVSMIFSAIFFGYSMGVSPIISFNYGAGNHHELRSLLMRSLIINLVTGIVMATSAIALSSAMASLFVGYDAQLKALTVEAFRISSWCYLFAGLNVFMSAFFTALNNGPVSATIAFLRGMVFQTLFVFLLPAVFSVNAIWFTVPAAEICGLLTSLFFLFKEAPRYHYFKV